MKNILNLCIAVLLLVACSNNEQLDRETALKVIEDSKAYPKVISFNIFVSDPAYAKRVLDAGLEEKGLVLVQKTRKLGDMAEPLISFSEKADPYLLPQSDNDKNDGIQRVKIAEEIIEKITGVQMTDGNRQAIIEFKTSFKNISPFSNLSKINLSKGKSNTVKLLLFDDGWRLE